MEREKERILEEFLWCESEKEEEKPEKRRTLFGVFERPAQPEKL